MDIVRVFATIFKRFIKKKKEKKEREREEKWKESKWNELKQLNKWRRSRFEYLVLITRNYNYAGASSHYPREKILS